MKKFLYLVAIVSMLSACEKTLLGEDPINNPIHNFEIFWEDFDEHYSLFEVRGSNWDSIYNEYRPTITDLTTEEELWQTFKSMISYLDDSHTFLLQPKVNFDRNRESDYFESGSEEVKQTQEEFSLPLLQQHYLEPIEEIDNGFPNLIHFYSKIKDKNIGYIYLQEIESNKPNFMDDVLSNIGNYAAIVLDLRNNTGGDDGLATQIAGRFTTSEQLIYTIEERNGPKHTDFSDKISYFSKKIGEQHFDKPLIVLTDKVTVSASEVLLFHLKSFEQVTQIGDTTAGDFSDTGMRRFLPNGWQYQYSIFKYLLPNGQSLDGIGHVPDIYVRNTLSDINSEEDKVLDRAIQFLFEEYGIQ